MPTPVMRNSCEKRMALVGQTSTQKPQKLQRSSFQSNFTGRMNLAPSSLFPSMSKQFVPQARWQALQAMQSGSPLLVAVEPRQAPEARAPAP